MPGVRIAYSLRAAEPPLVSRAGAEGARRPFVAEPGVRIVHADERVVVDAEGPDWYPLEFLAATRMVVCLEGRVYGRNGSSLLRKLEGIRQETPRSDEAFASRVRSCAGEVDGDFLIVCYDRVGERLCVAGDRFGRLPAYYHLSDRLVLVARDQRFVLARLTEPAVNRTGLAQLLLLGYPLGSGTLADGIRRLLPGEALVASPAGGRLVPTEGSPFRKDPRREAPRDVRRCAAELRDALVAACRDRRLAGKSHVLSLSGGLDSRAVGAGMRSALGGFSSVTFAAPGSPHPDERDCAARVAGALGADWRAYELDPKDPHGMEEIVRLKMGLNPINVGFGIEYVRRVQSDFPGPVAFWTGEGGDKLLYDHRAIPRRPSSADLARFIMVKQIFWSPEEIFALVGVHPDDLRESILAVVTSAKGVDAEDAYEHFLLSERAVRWLFEGEDRHRTHVWPVSPFYAHEVVALARAFPRDRKSGYHLYRAFLGALAPDLAEIPLPGGGPAPASFRFALKRALREDLRNNRYAFAAYRRLRSRLGWDPSRDDMWRAKLSSYGAKRMPPPPFDSGEVERIGSGRKRHPTHALPLLLTAMWAVEIVLGRGGIALPGPGRRA